MRQDIKPWLEHVKGSTYCIVTGYARIPLYKLNDREAIMLDSGLHRDWEGILACLEQEELNIKAVLTSHAHPDHDGNHLALRRRFGTKIYMSLYAAAVCAETLNQASSISDSSTYRQLSQYMVNSFRADEVMDWRQESITVEGACFKIIQLPGHSAEHMGFITPDNVAYLADVILSEFLVKALRTTYCTCVELDLESKEKVANLQCDRYILAHNGVCGEIRELAQLNRNSTLEKAARIESFADQYITLDGLVRKLLEATNSQTDLIHKVEGTRRNVKALVDYLLDMGRLTKRANNGAVEYIRVK